jgi:O-antigen/teichoic acid export membrane protein
MSHYAFFAAIGGLSFILCTNVDKLLLNNFLTTADVGIYSAYYVAALMLPSLLGSILNTILFPYASKEKNLLVIFKRLDNLFPYFLTIGGGLGCLSTFIFLSLFGKEYPVNFLLIFLFAFAGILVFYCGLIEWVINSVGIKGIKMTCGIDVIIAIGNVVLNIILIPIFGLFGAIFSTIIAFSIGLSILIIKRESVVI